MISIDKKFIFIHINKTAGTSIKQALQPGRGSLPPREPKRLPPGAISQDDIECKDTPHWTYDEYKRYFGSSFGDFFKFSVVRNPWDRVVSAYEYERSKHVRFRSWNRPRSNPPSFKEWVIVNYNCNFENRMFNPCTYWLGDEMDFIARFENLHEDFERTCKILNVKCKLGHYKRSKDRDHYINYYDSETREIIQTHFIKDIDAFNYKF